MGFAPSLLFPRQRAQAICYPQMIIITWFISFACKTNQNSKDKIGHAGTNDRNLLYNRF